MERLDQGHLHPLLEHPETNMSRPDIEPGSHAGKHSKELFEQLLYVLLWKIYKLVELFIYITAKLWQRLKSEPKPICNNGFDKRKNNGSKSGKVNSHLRWKFLKALVYMVIPDKINGISYHVCLLEIKSWDIEFNFNEGHM
jgi:hypothetical protein